MTGKIDPKGLPKGKVRSGDEADDAKQGGWWKAEREKMDQDFCRAMSAALGSTLNKPALS